MLMLDGVRQGLSTLSCVDLHIVPRNVFVVPRNMFVVPRNVFSTA